MITGLLAIVAGALVFDSAFAVPRYSAPVPQVGDPSSAVTARQVDSKASGAISQNPIAKIRQNAQACQGAAGSDLIATVNYHSSGSL